MPFKDRADAGRKSARALAGYKDEQPVLLALPRGGGSAARLARIVAPMPSSITIAVWPLISARCRLPK